jgi:hypothetical protein
MVGNASSAASIATAVATRKVLVTAGMTFAALIGSGRMELIPTDLILRRREAPSRRMAAGTLSLVAVLRDARKSALLRTRLIAASI